MATVAFSAEAAMPPAAAGILAQMDKEIDVARTKAALALEKVLKDTTKKGDLAGAMAVKEAIDQIKTECSPVRVASNAAAVVGRWRGGAWIFDFRPDFTAKQSDGVEGKWQLNGKTVDVSWDNGYKYRLSVTAEGLVGVQIAPNGSESPFQLRREK